MISGIVLAAGASRRFGATKQLVPASGKPLTQHSIDALDEAGAEEILVVTGHDADAVEAGLALPAQGRFLRNPDHRLGQSSSLAVALHALDEASEAAVVLMGDQPGITGAQARALIERFVTTRGRIVRLAFRDGPGPALLSREVYAEAGHLTGDVGARVLMASHPEWVEDVSIDALVPRDIDLPEDLRDEAARRFPGSAS
jgi:molybdenum cofactor cytidylyltransferase